MMLDSFVERARAVLTSVVTIVSAVWAVVLLAADEIVTWGLPEQVEGPVVPWLVRAAASLAGVVAPIRRVTPVPAVARGLAPPRGRPGGRGLRRGIRRTVGPAARGFVEVGDYRAGAPR